MFAGKHAVPRVEVSQAREALIADLPSADGRAKNRNRGFIRYRNEK